MTIEKMIKQFTLISVLLITCSFNLLATSQNIEGTLIKPENYFPTLTSKFKDAKKSILIVLSSFSFKEKEPDKQALKMLGSLVLASMEGVDIKIILNAKQQNLFKNNKYSKDEGLLLLKTSEIPLYFLSPGKQVYSNTIIIDESIIIEGSQPWISNLDLNNNLYSNWMIKSCKLAKEKKKDILSYNHIQNINMLAKPDSRSSINFLKLNSYLLENKSFHKLCKLKNSYVLDLYMILLLKTRQTKSNWFKLNLSHITSTLFPQVITKIGAKKKIISFLKKLKRMNLIKLNLKDKNTPSVKVHLKTEEPVYFKIPVNFFSYKYQNHLTLREKLLYFIVLKNYTISDNQKYLTINLKETAKKLNMQVNALKNGLIKLQKKLLIEPYPVAIATIDIPAFILLDPRNKKAINQALSILQQQYGKKIVDQSRLLTSQINKEFDPEIVRETIYYLQELGLVDTQKVFLFITQLPLNNRQRNFKEIKRHLVETLNNRLKYEN